MTLNFNENENTFGRIFCIFCRPPKAFLVERMRIDASETQETTKTDKQWSVSVFVRKVFCQIY